MLAVRGQPVEVLGAVVDAVEPPEEVDPVLQPMAPVDKEIAEQDHERELRDRVHRADELAHDFRRGRANPRAELREYPEDGAVEQQVLAEEEAQVGRPARAEEPLAGPGGERELERAEHREQHEEAGAGGEDVPGDRHRGAPRVVFCDWFIARPARSLARWMRWPPSWATSLPWRPRPRWRAAALRPSRRAPVSCWAASGCPGGRRFRCRSPGR